MTQATRSHTFPPYEAASPAEHQLQPLASVRLGDGATHPPQGPGDLGGGRLCRADRSVAPASRRQAWPSWSPGSAEMLLSRHGVAPGPAPLVCVPTGPCSRAGSVSALSGLRAHGWATPWPVARPVSSVGPGRGLCPSQLSPGTPHTCDTRSAAEVGWPHAPTSHAGNMESGGAVPVHFLPTVLSRPEAERAGFQGDGQWLWQWFPRGSGFPAPPPPRRWSPSQVGSQEEW